MIQLSNQQRLSQVNSEQLYESYISSVRHAEAYRHGIKWKEVGGRDYLIRGARFGEKSLGPRNEITEKIYREFLAGRDGARARVDKAVANMTEQARMNRALRLARAPEIVSKLLRKLDASHVASDFLVIGTQALYAYESMAGTHFSTELMASGDVDLLFDNRKSLSIVSKKLNNEGLLGLLRSIDRSFVAITPGGFRAHNSDNFMVDLVTMESQMERNRPVRLSPEDLVAAEVPGLQWLCNAPKISAIPIDEKGFPFPMQVPDPRAFALHKAWLSNQRNRDPRKKVRDHHQAHAVARMVVELLPQYDFDDADWLPNCLSEFKELLGLSGRKPDEIVFEG